MCRAICCVRAGLSLTFCSLLGIFLGAGMFGTTTEEIEDDFDGDIAIFGLIWLSLGCFIALIGIILSFVGLGSSPDLILHFFGCKTERHVKLWILYALSLSICFLITGMLLMWDPLASDVVITYFSLGIILMVVAISLILYLINISPPVIKQQPNLDYQEIDEKFELDSFS